MIQSKKVMELHIIRFKKSGLMETIGGHFGLLGTGIGQA